MSAKMTTIKSIFALNTTFIDCVEKHFTNRATAAPVFSLLSLLIAPLKVIKPLQRGMKTRPWKTCGMISLLEKEVAEHKWHTTRLYVFKITLLARLNIYNKAVWTSKLCCFSKLINSNVNNPRGVSAQLNIFLMPLQNKPISLLLITERKTGPCVDSFDLILKLCSTY